MNKHIDVKIKTTNSQTNVKNDIQEIKNSTVFKNTESNNKVKTPLEKKEKRRFIEKDYEDEHIYRDNIIKDDFFVIN